jgi:hypothetical protein
MKKTTGVTMNKHTKELKKLRSELLVSYINRYISKQGVIIKPIFETMKSRLLKHQSISVKQFTSIIKFIEREPQFRNWSADLIYSYFSPLFKQEHQHEDVQHQSLETFFS